MFKQLRRKFIAAYYRAIHSIGFYPTIISLGYFVFAILLLSLDLSSITHQLIDWFPWLLFKDIGTPRAVLTTLLAGILSLTVLSFSMVMVVLGQAASNYSPKILLGLVSEKSHQIVLGHYLGAIIYFMVLLAAFRQSNNYHLPSIGVFISIIIGIACLGLFVYFIHNTSQSIQINLIIKRIYEKTKRELQLELPEKAGNPSANTPPAAGELLIHSAQTGYIQNWNEQGLAAAAGRHGWTIHLLFQQGDYLLEQYPVVRIASDGELPDENQQQNILSHLTFYEGENISEHYHYGFTQLMEIAVKALSPAVNDPGTARLCIHYLTDLLRLRISMGSRTSLSDENGRLLLSWRTHTFESLLYKSLTPILQYGKTDVSICLSLIQALKTLAYFDEGEKHRALLQQHCDSVISYMQDIRMSGADQAFISERIRSGNTYLKLDF